MREQWRNSISFVYTANKTREGLYIVINLNVNVMITCGAVRVVLCDIIYMQMYNVYMYIYTYTNKPI